MRSPPKRPSGPVAKARPRAKTSRRQVNRNLYTSLGVSLALHAAILSLEFGVGGSGLPWLGKPWEERRADIPTLDVVLGAPPPVTGPATVPDPLELIPSQLPMEPVVAALPSQESITVAPSQPSLPLPKAPVEVVADPVVLDSQPPAALAGRVAVLSTHKNSSWSLHVNRLPPPDEAVAPPPLSAAAPEMSRIPARTTRGAEVAVTPSALLKGNQDALEQQRLEDLALAEAIRKWAEQAALAQANYEALEKRRLEDLSAAEAAKAVAEQAALARINQELLEKVRLEDLARAELAAALAEQAAVAQINREAQEKKRLEDVARAELARALAEQAAVAQFNREAQEKKRLEDVARAELARALAEQAVVAQINREAQEKKRLEDVARAELARALAEQAAVAEARDAALAKKADEQRALLSRQAAAQRDRPVMDRNGAAAQGVQGDAAGQPSRAGLELAEKALDQIRSSRFGGAVSDAPDSSRRRGSILGREANSIQLAFYGESWKQKVERIGRMNYPQLSKDRVYASPVVTVSIKSDGTLVGMRIDKSSGDQALDDAVLRIVERSAPFAAFPPELKRSYDVVDITRTWTFLENMPQIGYQ